MKLLSLITLALVLIALNSARAEDFPGLREPLKTVTEKYLLIDQKLASDSFDGVTAAAIALRIRAGPEHQHRQRNAGKQNGKSDA